MRLIFILLIILFSETFNLQALPPELHPVHVSIVNMDIINDGSIHFSAKLFIDDFETVINKKNNSNINFTEKTRQKTFQKYVEDYLYENLKIEGIKPIGREAYTLEKFKIEDLAVWFYFKIEAKEQNIKRLKVSNSLMFDLYKDQTNLLILSYKGKEMAYSYNNSERAYTFVLE